MLIRRLVSRIRAEDQPIKFIFSRLFWVTGICQLFLIKCNGYILRFYPTALSCGLWVDSSYREEDENFLNDYLKKDDIVVDIGANIGSLSIFSATKVGQDGKVFAFEPHPKIFKFLKKNVVLNRLANVLCFNLGIGNKNENKYLSSIRSDDMNSVIHSKNKSSINIKIKKLDDVLVDNINIALIKIDVEGYEKFALEGSLQVLKRTACLYFESSEDHFKQYGYSSRDLFNLIRLAGFQIYSLRRPKSLFLISESHISCVGENLIAIKHKDDFIKRTGYFLL